MPSALARLILCHVYCAAAGEAGGAGGGAGGAPAGGSGAGGTGGEGKPELVKVTLQGGVEIEMPKDKAEALTAARAKDKAEREDMARRLGAIEAEKRKADEAAAAAMQEREVVRLAKDGEVAKVREMLTAEATAKLAALQKIVGRQALESAAMRAAPGLAAVDVQDIVSLHMGRVAVDAASGQVRILGDDGQPMMRDGQPMGADAYLAEWLASRPRFQTAKVPAGTGGAPASGQGGSPGTIRRADLDKVTAAQVELMRQGKLVIVD